MKVLRSPIASPKANSICERVIGTIRRECLDWMIPCCGSPEVQIRHRLAAGALVLAKSVLGGVHHEYSIGTATVTSGVSA